MRLILRLSFPFFSSIFHFCDLIYKLGDMMKHFAMNENYFVIWQSLSLQVCDVILFLVNGEEGVPVVGGRILSLLRAQGMPSAMVLLQVRVNLS